ncbi:MAG: hypothetical protein JO159_14205 [Acidobacteria bacterium]|nr:hypothetical protein [Acidobacteriota bacterium]MBV9625623.1 hypothetical protein [Acidobacteriota bacterium]
MAEPTRTEFSSVPEPAGAVLRAREAPIKPETEKPVEERLTSARSGLLRLSSRAQQGFSVVLLEARSRFRYLKNERPLELVAGIAAAAFLAGAALRIWKSSQE